MHNWRLLLLAFLAVLQPIVSFTERNLFDGREQCCDRNSLLRDSRLSYGHRFNKLPEDHRLSPSAVRTDRSYEVKREYPALTRSLADTRFVEVRSESNEKRFNLQSRAENRREAANIQSERLSTLHDDRHRHVRETQRISSRNVDRRSRESNKRQHAGDFQDTSSFRASRDDSRFAQRNMQSERRVRMSMDSRRETRWSRDNSEERGLQERREAREVLQRTRNDVAGREMLGARQDRREFRKLAEKRRSQSGTRLQLDNNRELRSFDQRVRETTDERRCISPTELSESRVNVREMFARRERNLDARKEVREAQARFAETREAREHRDRNSEARRETRDRQVRSTDARGEIREARDRSFTARRNTPDFEARREIHESRIGNLEMRERYLEARQNIRVGARREIREARDRTLEARREISEFRFRNPEARERSLENRREVREIRDRSLEVRREIREARGRSLENYRSARDMSLEARREVRDSQFRNLEARELSRTHRYARDRSQDARKDVREAQDRTLETRQNVEVRDRTLEARRESRESRARSLGVYQDARVASREIHDSRYRQLEARERTSDAQRDRTLDARKDIQDFRHARARTLEARREVREFKGKNLERRDKISEARRDVREARDRSLEARREIREARSRSFKERRDVRDARVMHAGVERAETRRDSRVEDRRSAMNHRERNTPIEKRRVDYRRITDMESRAQHKFHDAQREMRMIRSLDTRERDVSGAQAEFRKSESTKRDSRFHPNTEMLRNRESFMSVNGKSQYDSEPRTMNWQYILYTTQGIYLCGVLMQMISQKESSKKKRFFSWLATPRSLIKVD